MKFQSLSNTYASTVLPKTANQFFGLIELIVGNARLTPTLWYSLTDINWITVRQSIQFRLFFVDRIFARVIDSVNPCTKERFWRGQRVYRGAVKEPDGIFDELNKSVVFIYVLTSVESF